MTVNKSGPPRNPIRVANSAPSRRRRTRKERRDSEYKRRGGEDWQSDPSAPQPDAPEFGAQEKIGPLRSG